MKGKWLQLAGSLLITCLFLFLAYRSLDTLNPVHLLQYPIHYLYVILAISAYAASQWFRALSWTRGLAPDIPLRAMFASVCMGNGANMLLPFRMGEAVRVITAGRVRQEYGVVSMNLVVERMVDVLILALLAVSAAFFVPFESVVEAKLAFLRKALLAAIAGGGVALMLVFRFRARILASVHIPSFMRRAIGLVVQCPLLQSPWVGVRVLFYIGCSWACVYISTVFGLMAVGIYDHTAWIASLVVVVMTNLIMLIPSAPGGIGVFQYACIYSLSLFDVQLFQKALLSVLLHLIQYVALLPLTLYYFVRGECTLRDVYRSATGRQRFSE
ncbi:lysylphosphatidylglycerol synthase transmembrane domain-containing protein [Aneurinibacillus sp. REN35]|uniref:lysylphosphatidylglycerol synthase transmembrane domain-containing protein n=1 Tax=Aneurinibacillus sp. REN35 TaxID=3237286 RepID=UPI003527C2F8